MGTAQSAAIDRNTASDEAPGDRIVRLPSFARPLLVVLNFAAQARCQHLLDELVAKARAGPDRLAQPSGQLLPAGIGDLVHAAVWTQPCLLLDPRGNQAFMFHFVDYLVNVTSI